HGTDLGRGVLPAAFRAEVERDAGPVGHGDRLVWVLVGRTVRIDRRRRTFSVAVRVRVVVVTVVGAAACRRRCRGVDFGRDSRRGGRVGWGGWVGGWGFADAGQVGDQLSDDAVTVGFVGAGRQRPVVRVGTRKLDVQGAGLAVFPARIGAG